MADHTLCVFFESAIQKSQRNAPPGPCESGIPRRDQKRQRGAPWNGLCSPHIRFLKESTVFFDHGFRLDQDQFRKPFYFKCFQ